MYRSSLCFWTADLWVIVPALTVVLAVPVVPAVVSVGPAVGPAVPVAHVCLLGLLHMLCLLLLLAVVDDALLPLLCHKCTVCHFMCISEV